LHGIYKSKTTCFTISSSLEWLCLSAFQSDFTAFKKGGAFEKAPPALTRYHSVDYKEKWYFSNFTQNNFGKKKTVLCTSYRKEKCIFSTNHAIIFRFVCI